MKVLVIGSKGSTGKRYCSILRGMGHDVVEYDLTEHSKSERLPKFDKAIIATPTKTHCEYHDIIYYNRTFEDRFQMNTDILIEKPATDNIYDIQRMFCKMVCNWAFVFPDRILQPGKHTVFYECSNHGNEGFWFDTCQLHILSNGRGRIGERINTFYAEIDGEKVTRDMIEASYVRMIDAWFYRPYEIWNVQYLIPELSYIIRKHEIENEQK